jgi:hypothetical protein
VDLSVESIDQWHRRPPYRACETSAKVTKRQTTSAPSINHLALGLKLAIPHTKRRSRQGEEVRQQLNYASPESLREPGRQSWIGTIALMCSGLSVLFVIPANFPFIISYLHLTPLVIASRLLGCRFRSP